MPDTTARPLPIATQTASFAKRGRNPRFPFVPIVKHHAHPPGFAVPKDWTYQIRGFAFTTREEAIAYAQKYINANWPQQGNAR